MMLFQLRLLSRLAIGGRFLQRGARQFSAASLPAVCRSPRLLLKLAMPLAAGSAHKQ